MQAAALDIIPDEDPDQALREARALASRINDGSGQVVLTETAAIITFLAEQFPDKHLIPDAGSLARGEFYRWLCFFTFSLSSFLSL